MPLEAHYYYYSNSGLQEMVKIYFCELLVEYFMQYVATYHGLVSQGNIHVIVYYVYFEVMSYS